MKYIWVTILGAHSSGRHLCVPWRWQGLDWICSIPAHAKINLFQRLHRNPLKVNDFNHTMLYRKKNLRLRCSAVFLMFDMSFWMPLIFAERGYKQGYDLFVNTSLRYHINDFFCPAVTTNLTRRTQVRIEFEDVDT